MNLVFWLAVAAVLVVLVFDYTNGFHDAANIVATMIWTAIKMREFYALQEEVLDRCEDAAKTIEEILIENS